MNRQCINKPATDVDNSKSPTSMVSMLATTDESMSLRSLMAATADGKELTSSPQSVVDAAPTCGGAGSGGDHSNSEYSNGDYSNSSSRAEEEEGRPIPSRRRSSVTTRMSFLRLLHFNPNTDQGLIAVNEVEIRNILAAKPTFAKQRYQFQMAFPDHKISPLSLLCALGATLKTIQVCYEADPHALSEVDAVLGTPLHYACSYKADKCVVEFLLSQFPRGYDTMMDKNKHNLLHVAAQYGASKEILANLAHRTPLALYMTDVEGNTPLHLALESGAVDSEEVVQVLLGNASVALCTKKNFAGATPLHLAIYAGAPFVVIQALVEAHEMTLRSVDGKGRLPLHVAAAEGAELSTFIYLLRKYREAINVKDKRGRTPYEVAEKHNRPSDVQILLRAKRMATL